MAPSLNAMRKSLQEMQNQPMVFRGSGHDLGFNGMLNTQLQPQAVYTSAATIN